MLAGACRLVGDVPTTLVAADDGLDEVSSSAATMGSFDLTAAGIREDRTIDPRSLGIRPPWTARCEATKPAAAAECCQRILQQGSTA